MNNILSAAIVLFGLALVTLFITIISQGAVETYAHLFFYAFLAASGLLTLFYFLITRRGKDRSY